ncbi:aminotransferase class I/II-fold pyridoxal phosphate-dependent enzyme, partial [bacterium]|nr:aminotransferase class I/II-fold pyridoxal phosphate-dependent enzyme [bacterium]
MHKTILMTGGSGLLSTNWALSIRDEYKVTLLLHQKKISLLGVNTEIVSLSSLEECLSVLEKHQPDIVIHTAGLANVEECESNPNLAQTVNVDLAKNIATACSNQGVKLVHISTDHLFLGDQEFSTEESVINPVNNYAKSKFLGEKQVLENCKDALIIRTNFYGWGTKYRQSFSDLILDKLKNNQQVDLFSDVFFTPILIDELSKRTHQLIDANTMGVFNIVSSERVSKYEFGIKLANCFNLDVGLINTVSINDKPNLVKRPKDMSLSNTKLCQMLNCEIATLDEQLQILKEQEDKSITNQVVLDIIPYGKHYIDEDDIQAVVNVLKYGMLTQGPKVAEFESRIADYVGVKYAVAVSNGTAALHLACMALELGNGDEVITTPNTFVATSNSILYVGAKPVFVDIDPKTLNIDVERIEDTIKISKNIKAIFPVHFAGLPCDMKQIKKLADKYNLAVVEDAAHALGATYNNGNKVGNCEYADMTCFSFHPVKGIAAGEGGMITTNDFDIYRKLTLLRSHGITKGNFEFPGVSRPDNSLVNKDAALEAGELKRWYYEMQSLGFNYRITDIQSALAISQMGKIDLFLDARRSMVKVYDKAFKDIPNITPLQAHGRDNSSHHIYVVSIDFDKIGMTRHQFM